MHDLLFPLDTCSYSAETGAGGRNGFEIYHVNSSDSLPSFNSIYSSLEMEIIELN